MKNVELLSRLVEKIELEILTSEESALIGGAADSILGNNCKCNGNNCDCNYGGNNCKCNGNNCSCNNEIPTPDPGATPIN